jgi:hypothetical protein
VTSPTIEMPTSKSGLPFLVIDGIPYHSSYDPRRESARFFNDLKLEEADVVIQFGFGLGYGAEALCSRTKPTARILVFEPNDELLRLSRSCFEDNPAWRDPRFQFVSGDSVCHFFSHNPPLWCQETDKILWVEWPPAVKLHGPLLEELKQTFRLYLRDRAANLLTHFQNGRMYFENVIRNYPYQGDADLGRLVGKFKGQPVVIVSAGPSLDRNIRQLSGIEDYCLIIAVDTALRPLLEAGVTPHAVIIADPTELNARHVVGALPKETYLIAEQGVHPSALTAASRRFLFGLGLFPDLLFAKFGIRRTRLDVWGSVATAALDFACQSGTKTVILAGQDFGYSWNREYARHTIFDCVAADPEKEPKILARDIWNRDIPTSENLVAYRDFFVRRMKSEPQIRFINATEGGILTESAEILSLRDALFQICNRPAPARAVLESSHQTRKVTRAPLDHLQLALQSRSSDCNCRGGFLELVAKEAVLRGDQTAQDDAIAWGLEIIAGSE